MKKTAVPPESQWFIVLADGTSYDAAGALSHILILEKRCEELKTRATETEEELVALRTTLRAIADCGCNTGLAECGCVTCLASRALGQQAWTWAKQCPMCHAPYATKEDLKRSWDRTLSDDLQPWEAALCWMPFSDGPHSVAPEAPSK